MVRRSGGTSNRARVVFKDTSFSDGYMLVVSFHTHRNQARARARLLCGCTGAFGPAGSSHVMGGSSRLPWLGIRCPHCPILVGLEWVAPGYGVTVVVDETKTTQFGSR